MEALANDIKLISESMEKLSKRLRRVEVLSRLAQVEQVDSFLELTDTPDSYEGMYGWVPKINNLENGLEFMPIGGGACVAFTCGAVGWRGAGGSEVRTLVHETAFQLDAEGNDRGAYAIDLQQDRSFAVEIAGGDYSLICGLDNQIDPGADHSLAFGNYNYIYAAGGFAPYAVHAMGCCHEVYDDCYMIFALGVAIDVAESDYVYAIGSNHEFDAAFGCFTAIERNDFLQNAFDAPIYCASIGILNLIDGDVFEGYQYGESNSMFGSGDGGYSMIWEAWQFGYNNYIGLQGNNIYQFGRSLGSYLPAGLAGDFFNGRIMLDGDNLKEGSTNTPSGLGFNQNSWFGQNMAINTWPSSWTTGRFQFPIIEDSIWGFTARITGTELGCANSYDWKIEGTVQNAGGTTTLLWSTVTNNYRDVATKEWQVAADDANDRLIFQYRDTAGPDATRCNIEFMMHTTEVGFEY